MANRLKHYPLPDGATTTDIDVYIATWKALATPIEQHMGLSLTGFDPDFSFIKGSAQYSQSTIVHLPYWFVRDLCQLIQTNQPIPATISPSNTMGFGCINTTLTSL